MADDKDKKTGAAGPEAPATRGGPSWLVVALASALALAVGAGGAWFAFGSGGGATAEVEAAAETGAHGTAAGAPADPTATYTGRLVDLEPFVVNVAGDGYARFLKLKIELEADSEIAKQELEGRKSQVRDTTILLLSSKRLADITDFEGKALLKDDLRERIDELLEHGKVESVLFTEFVVQ